MMKTRAMVVHFSIRCYFGTVGMSGRICIFGVGYLNMPSDRSSIVEALLYYQDGQRVCSYFFLFEYL